MPLTQCTILPHRDNIRIYLQHIEDAYLSAAKRFPEHRFLRYCLPMIMHLCSGQDETPGRQGMFEYFLLCGVHRRCGLVQDSSYLGKVLGPVDAKRRIRMINGLRFKSLTTGVASRSLFCCDPSFPQEETLCRHLGGHMALGAMVSSPKPPLVNEAERMDPGFPEVPAAYMSQPYANR